MHIVPGTTWGNHPPAGDASCKFVGKLSQSPARERLRRLKSSPSYRRVIACRSLTLGRTDCSPFGIGIHRFAYPGSSQGGPCQFMSLSNAGDLTVGGHSVTIPPSFVDVDVRCVSIRPRKLPVRLASLVIPRSDFTLAWRIP